MSGGCKVAQHLSSAPLGQVAWGAQANRNIWFGLIVQLKLLNSSDSYQEQCSQLKSLESIKELHCAILASQLALSFCPAIKGQPDYQAIQQDWLATGLVDRHMRILKSIEDNYCLNVASPSEPILAIVATLVMMPLHEIRQGNDFKAKVKA